MEGVGECCGKTSTYEKCGSIALVNDQKKRSFEKRPRKNRCKDTDCTLLCVELRELGKLQKYLQSPSKSHGMGFCDRIPEAFERKMRQES